MGRGKKPQAMPHVIIHYFKRHP